ncbi:MAG: Na/Pi cotransporter family protein [Planctomycetales bacterium]|nr:Na/Pi cotransporter family protein [Planctomycetales bacterium]
MVDMLGTLVGGLGIFLFGMKAMSDGMQAVAGPGLRRLISAVTNHRVVATVIGTLVTCVVQSSSVTTVMVVGFVNSGLMQLSQAIGVIMGANIGTTITGWILVLKVGKYGLPILGVSAFVYLFSKGDRWRYTSMAIMGIGMVFVGLELMKDACGTIEELPQFAEWFQAFRADSLLGVLKCVLAGCVLTTLVQSSSATLGITVALTSNGLIGFETAAALVMGENIGTTITALLASIGANTNARRAAYFHVLFNVIGVIWITCIFYWYVDWIGWMINQWLSWTVEPGTTFRDAVVGADGEKTYPNASLAVVSAHSIFNIVNTLIFMPFVPLFDRLLTRLVPSREGEASTRLTDLDIRMLETPAMAIEQSRREIRRMGETCHEMLLSLTELRNQDRPDKALADRLKQREQLLDGMQDEIAAFVTGLLSGNVSHSLADEARGQLRMADEFESISDYLTSLDKFDRKLRRDGHRFEVHQREGLDGLNRLVDSYVSAVNEALVKGAATVMVDTEAVSKRIRQEIKQLRRKHLEEISGGLVPPTVTVAFLASLNAYGRVRDHAHNIAETLSGEK